MEMIKSLFSFINKCYKSLFIAYREWEHEVEVTSRREGYEYAQWLYNIKSQDLPATIGVLNSHVNNWFAFGGKTSFDYGIEDWIAEMNSNIEEVL